MEGNLPELYTEEEPLEITEAHLMSCLPPKMRKGLSDTVVTNINNALNDPTMMDQFRENFITYAHVLQDGRYKMSAYINAVKFASYKLMNCGNREAYVKTFPKKYAEMVAAGVPEKDIHARASIFNKTKLVVAILEQSLVPTHIVNAHLHQEGINVLADLMRNAKSEKVRQESANNLITHLKLPETAKIEIDVTHKTDSVITALREQTLQLVKEQQNSIDAGAMTVKEAAQGNIIIDVEGEEIDE